MGEGVTNKHKLDAASMAAKVIDWYRHNARDLPWRRTKDPYCIFVSEIMISETQIA
jgi:A/G-specific adenine glycosylase